MINTLRSSTPATSNNKFINATATQADLLRQSRLSTLLVGGISIGVAIVFQDVFGLMIYLFKLWPSAILPPLMCGLLWGKILPYAAPRGHRPAAWRLFPLERQGTLGSPSASPPTS